MNFLKISQYALLAASCAVMASCSNDNEPNGNEVLPLGTESGYVSVGINLPTVAGTGSRAVTEAQGTASEYAVANGRIIVFQKASSESAATFVCMSELNGLSWGNATSGEVTVAGKGVTKLSNINLSDNAYQYSAVVVLNYNDSFVWPVANQTYGSWSKTVQGDMTLTKDGQTYLTMTSAAKFNGTGTEPTLLTDINKSRICQTEALAFQSEAALTTFVQRNVAKVSVVTDAAFTGNVSSEAYPGDKVTINGWGLDITNKTTYPVQVTEGLSASYADIWKGGNKLNRFFGNGTSFQRVFWAMDPNYDKSITTLSDVAANFYTISDVTSNPACLYALENTFDIDHQMQGQTTRVIVKATYQPAGFAAGETFFKIGSATTLWSAANLQAEILAKATAQQGNASGVQVTLGDNFSAAGYHALSEVTITRGGNKLSNEDYDAVAQSLGLASAADKSIASHKDGKSYYVARVKHFGDADTPWTMGQPTYGGNNENWLGRYGMVRNNWYEVNVKSINGPGEPGVPEIDPTVPDDENNYYITVSVNILSWAKRTQDVGLE